mgnify:CR=1 FL=1
MAAAFTSEVLEVSGCKVTLKRGGSGPTLLYLHDMAVAPEARSLGLASRLLAQLRQRAQALALPRLGLVAVQGSVPYWQRQGFAELAAMPAPLAAKLATFGPDASFMVSDQ